MFFAYSGNGNIKMNVKSQVLETVDFPLLLKVTFKLVFWIWIRIQLYLDTAKNLNPDPEDPESGSGSTNAGKK